MMERWLHCTSVVTGASAGIGAAICVSLANAGINIVGLARRPDRVDALKSQVSCNGTISSYKCDISNAEEVTKAFKWIEETFGAIHIMINNAGVLYNGSFTGPNAVENLGGGQCPAVDVFWLRRRRSTMFKATCPTKDLAPTVTLYFVAKHLNNDMISEAEMLATLDINVKGTLLCTRHAINSMQRHKINGHIININSIAGHYIPSALNMYPSTKHAITAFSAGLLSELARKNNRIKVTSVSPGLVRTELPGLTDLDNCLPALLPKDVADAVLYILSTPPNVNIDELTITSVTEKRL